MGQGREHRPKMLKIPQTKGAEQALDCMSTQHTHTHTHICRDGTTKPQRADTASPGPQAYKASRSVRDSVPQPRATEQREEKGAGRGQGKERLALTPALPPSPKCRLLQRAAGLSCPSRGSGSPVCHDFLYSPVCCCCAVAKSCPTLCDPVDCSTPGPPAPPISRSLFKRLSSESVKPSNHLILCRPLLLSSSIFIYQFIQICIYIDISSPAVPPLGWIPQKAGIIFVLFTVVSLCLGQTLDYNRCSVHHHH